MRILGVTISLPFSLPIDLHYFPSHSVELDANKPVSFRLSANIAHFLGLSAEGHYAGALIAVARCFHSRQVQHLLRPILWDFFAEAAAAAASDTDQGGSGAGTGELTTVGMTLQTSSTTLVSHVKRAMEAIMGRTKSRSSPPI